MSPEALLFDFDGTLVDTEWAIYSAWKRTFAAHGHELPLETYVQCIGSDFDTWSPKTHLEELTGDFHDWHDLDARRQEEIMAELSGQGPMPGARDALSSLADYEGELAVVSSSSHDWVDGWLERLGMAHHFAATICRGDAPRIKPAPDLYLRAAEVLGVAPERCLVIEDSLNGTRSAKAAGMRVAAIPNRVTEVSDFSEADQVFSGFAEFIVALHENKPCKQPVS